MYGTEVQVNYYDVSDARVGETQAGILAELEMAQYPLPVVLINGLVAFSGSLEPLQVVVAVAEERLRQQANAAL